MRAAILAAAVAVAGCAATGASIPPPAYRGDGTVFVTYVDSRLVHERCERLFGPLSGGRKYQECGGRVRGVAMSVRPNPCRQPWFDARSCHEDVAHAINGWLHEFGGDAK